MAKHGRTGPARRQAFDDTLLIRSAESLGRMIGSLQRQLDGASRKLAAGNRLGGKVLDSSNEDARPSRNRKNVRATGVSRTGGTAVNGARTRSTKTTKSTKNAKGGSKSGATKVRSTADRTSKRAAKASRAKKTAGRSRSGATRKAAKTARRRS